MSVQMSKLLAMFRGASDPSTIAVSPADNVPVAAQSDRRGNLFARILSTTSTGIPATVAGVNQGNIFPQGAGSVPTNTSLTVAAGNYFLASDGNLYPGILRGSIDALDLAVFPANSAPQIVTALNVGYNGATFDRFRSVAGNVDGQAALTLGQQVTQGRNSNFNGATFDRQRGNTDNTLLASAVRAATTPSTDQTNYNGRGILLVFDITAVPGVQTVTLTIQGRDPLSGAYYTILAGAAQVAVSTIVMRVYPGLTAVANLTANDIIPRTWRVNVEHSGAGNFTYSVGASVIL